jgi:ABC-type bacteriocin/lantibiotic exporter with double-glycine peptidase domain
MPLKPLFYKQETPYSCVPACVRMVLTRFGRELSEAELRALCDCTPFGTEALNAVDAVRQLGFVGTGKYTLSTDELAAQVRRGLSPIVFVSTLPLVYWLVFNLTPASDSPSI